MFISVKKKFRFNCAAANPSVPLPANGPKTKSPTNE